MDQHGVPPPSYDQTFPTEKQPDGYDQPPNPGQPVPEQPVLQHETPAVTEVVVSQADNVPIIPAQPYPQSYMAVSIFGCLFCIWPIGICAIIASRNVQSAIARGDITSAQSSSRKAKDINIINFIGGILLILTIVSIISDIRRYGF
ncbi:proline-rich transmembrane protein 1-like isoform X1 [Argopecten irradians]|uniref:proline-rich transmembrane protein 1-like isoform X1 n=1 Tax=Argopecten irradians TaxID=31199 RepID=UPI003712E6B4